MKPYSQDLRERALAALEDGETQAEVAAQYGIHKSTLEKWWYRQRDTNRCAAHPHAGGRARTLQPYDAFIRREVQQQPDVSLQELCERLAARHAVRASPSMMCRTLQRLQLPRKKSRHTPVSKTRRVSSTYGNSLANNAARA